MAANGRDRGDAEVAARPWWWAFVAVAVVHLGAQAIGSAAVQVATKPLLMPLLLVWFLVAAPRGRLRTLVAVALVWSWLGDLGLMGDGELWFLAGLGAFLVAQLTYSVAFWPWWRRSVAGRRPPVLLAPYVVVLAGLLAVLWPELGDLRAPVVVYAIVIVTMAVLATGLGWLAGVGAALFVVSDSLIALTSLTDAVAVPASGFWVMLTYTAGQALLARGAAAAAVDGGSAEVTAIADTAF